MQRWATGADDQRRVPKREPHNRIGNAQREGVISLLKAARFRNLPPKQIVPALADEGRYMVSEATMYRLLRSERLLTHRRRIVGWQVLEHESADEAGRLVERTCREQAVEASRLHLHSDIGGPMKGATMLATLQRLGVVASFSRPRVSDDNPFPEALCRTLKYRPGFPNRPFRDIDEARSWVTDFVRWYNTEHLHSSLNFVTPDDRYFGRDAGILAARHHVYTRARDKHPERWSGDTRNWSPVPAVTLNPSQVVD